METCLICWGLFIAFLVLPAGVAVGRQFQAGRLAQTFAEVDFVYFYGLGRLFDKYPPEEVYDYELQKKVYIEVHPLQGGTYNPVPYPPFIGVLFRPFARMPYFSAYLLWLAISFGLYIAGIGLLTTSFFPRDPVRASLVFCFALCFYPFINWALLSGHLSTIGFFSMAWAFREEDLERPFRSGAALSICLYKPTLLVLLLPMLIVTRRFRTLFGFAVGGSTLALFATAVEGVRVWPGYFKLLLAYGLGVGGVASHPFKQAWKYVDFDSFASLFPGGRTGLGRMVLVGCVLWAAFSLIRAWWESNGARKPASTLVWATTITWTLVLNVYVPIYDSILVVISAIATAGVLKAVSGRYYRCFTVLWVLILGSSWITVTVAETAGVQVITLMLTALGALQLAGARRAIQACAALRVSEKECGAEIAH
jgi:hypothetical protein